MNLDYKNGTKKPMLLFTKVYVYKTNTKKPWDKLTTKEFDSKKFEWTCIKWFMVSNEPLTEQEVKDHIKSCPELENNKFDKHLPKDKTKNKNTSYWYDIYAEQPIVGEYDLKLLIDTIGLRMLHFVNNRSDKNGKK